MKDAVEITQKNIPVSDLGLVAALSLSFQYEAYRQPNDAKVYFLFENVLSVRKAIEDYWEGNLIVSARAYSEQLKNTKSKIYGGAWRN